MCLSEGRRLPGRRKVVVTQYKGMGRGLERATTVPFAMDRNKFSILTANLK